LEIEADRHSPPLPNEMEGLNGEPSPLVLPTCPTSLALQPGPHFVKRGSHPLQMS
jgi:hypothetical protein